MHKTTQFTLNIGVNQGYYHNNEINKETDTHVMNLWQEEAEEVYKKKGIYISAIISSTKTIYKKEWGCPIGGEVTVTIFGIRNPEYQKDDNVWRDSVIEISKVLRTRLNQTTAYLHFSEVDFFYLKGE